MIIMTSILRYSMSDTYSVCQELHSQECTYPALKGSCLSEHLGPPVCVCICVCVYMHVCEGTKG